VVQGWCFGVMGQRLATRLRTLMLKSLLRQEAAFFDRPENAPSALMSSLAGDAASVRGAVGDRLGVLATVLSCIVASYTIAFINRCARPVCTPCAHQGVCVQAQAQAPGNAWQPGTAHMRTPLRADRRMLRSWGCDTESAGVPGMSRVVQAEPH
jgi:hypothetical protein